LETYLEQALAAGHLAIERTSRGERIRYVAVDHSESWKDPEEKVRAEYYAELIHRYGYKSERIGVEIIVPDRTPHDAADLIVFHDDERKRPFAVIECKAEHYGGRPISKPVFDQAVEQAWGNGNAHKFRAAYVGVVAGQTRRFLDCDEKFGALERDSNQVADLPINYGKPPPYKFVKGGIDGKRDISAVEKGDLIAAKAFRTVTAEVKQALPAATKVQRIEERRIRRNGFFHSEDLLDLTLHNHAVNEALADVLDYGALLFGKDWDDEIASTGNMETSIALLRLDCRARSDQSIGSKTGKVLKSEPRKGEKPTKNGCQVTHWPDDHHLILTLRNGGKDLRDRLRALLTG
jgi:hypothetical protein